MREGRDTHEGRVAHKDKAEQSLPHVTSLSDCERDLTILRFDSILLHYPGLQEGLEQLCRTVCAKERLRHRLRSSNLLLSEDAYSCGKIMSCGSIEAMHMA